MRVVRALLGPLMLIVNVCMAAAHAEEWPNRYVKIVVPYGAGGISDVLGRITADKLSTTFGQRFIVETRAGANGAIGTADAVRSPADGYTLYEAGGGQFSVLPLIQKLPYNPLTELDPVSMLAVNGMALVVNRDLPVRTLQEFIEYVRAHPDTVYYGSVGRGSSGDLVPAAFAAKTGLKLTNVPYPAAPPAIMALKSGVVHMFFGNISDVIASIQSGEVRLLAVSTAARLPQYPDVPTVSEVVPGFVMTAWNGYFAPAGTPRPIVNRLSEALARICRDPDVVSLMSRLGLDPVGGTPEELRAAIQADLPIYRAAVEAAGLMSR